jgi:hypothetical protein
MNEEKIKAELDIIVKNYKSLPMNVEVIQESFINEMAMVLSGAAIDSDHFEEIMKFFKNYKTEI